MLLSVVIPLYNCEKYIENCIASLYRQNIPEDNFEIIVVNDGSTDNGLAVVEQLKKSHTNIKTFSQENKGLGLTRNKGIAEACGDYIAFVDSDDEIHDGAFGHMLSKTSHLPASETPDLIIFKYQDVLMGDTPKHFDLDSRKILFTGNILDFGNTYGLHPIACNKLYRREFLDRYKFNDSCYAEDLQFMAEIFASTDTKVVYFDLPIYFYFMRQNSMIHNYSNDYVKRIIDVYCNIIKKVNSSPLPKIYNSDKIDSFILTHIQSVAVVKLHSTYFSIKEIKQHLRNFKSCGILPLRFTPNKIVKLLSFSCKHPYFLWAFSIFFRQIYLKHLKK